MKNKMIWKDSHVIKPTLRWPKRVNHKSVYQNTKQFPKHKAIFQNTDQFTKTQNNFPKHKSVYRNTKQFHKTQPIFQNTNQLSKTQINFSKHKPISSKHKSKDWALALLLSESLERTHSQDFPRLTWRLLICCRCSKMVCHNSTCRSEVLQEYFFALNVEQS